MSQQIIHFRDFHKRTLVVLSSSICSGDQWLVFYFNRNSHPLTVVTSGYTLLSEWVLSVRTILKTQTKDYLRCLCIHIGDNCSVCAQWNVLFLPLLKSGMWRFIDVWLILLLSSGIKVYSYPIKVFFINWIIETAMFSISPNKPRLKSFSETMSGAQNPLCFH